MFTYIQSLIANLTLISFHMSPPHHFHPPKPFPQRPFLSTTHKTISPSQTFFLFRSPTKHSNGFLKNPSRVSNVP